MLPKTSKRLDALDAEWGDSFLSLDELQIRQGNVSLASDYTIDLKDDLGVLAWSDDERLATDQVEQSGKYTSGTISADTVVLRVATPIAATMQDTREAMEMQLVLLDLLVRKDHSESLVQGMA